MKELRTPTGHTFDAFTSFSKINSKRHEIKNFDSEKIARVFYLKVNI